MISAKPAAGRSFKPSDERAAHLVALVLRVALDALFAAHRFLRQKPLAQADLLAHDPEARPTAARVRGAHRIGAQRCGHRRRERIGRAAQAAAPHEQIGHAREAVRRAIAAREHGVGGVREVFAEQVTVAGLSLQIELGCASSGRGLRVVVIAVAHVAITIAITTLIAAAIAAIAAVAARLVTRLATAFVTRLATAFVTRLAAPS